jgi:hypothetical protein
MMNFLGKALVLFHMIFSIVAVTVALWMFMRGRDLANAEPRREAVKWKADGGVETYERIASEYDKSVAALLEAAANRDRTYIFVKPALDRIADTEPSLPFNHLHYMTLIDRVRNSPDNIEVHRFKDSGLEITRPIIGKPIPEDTAVAKLTKSYKSYDADLTEINTEIKKIDDESKVKIKETQKFVRDLTGQDPGKVQIEPGLYQLLDQEFKAQTQLKTEIDELKPYWSKATEQARLYIYRLSDLEATLQKLKAPPPKVEKKK